MLFIQLPGTPIIGLSQLSMDGLKGHLTPPYKTLTRGASLPKWLTNDKRPWRSNEPVKPMVRLVASEFNHQQKHSLASCKRTNMYSTTSKCTKHKRSPDVQSIFRITSLRLSLPLLLLLLLLLPLLLLLLLPLLLLLQTFSFTFFSNFLSYRQASLWIPFILIFSTLRPTQPLTSSYEELLPRG
jgi:hypothetical protein